MDVERITAEELLVHAAGLRRLASRLVADGADADDLVQETLVAGLENPPTRTQPLFHWLVRVMRNFATARWRVESTRARREHAAAQSEAIPSDAELVERMELHRVVADEVLALPEPYRTAILSLYFDEVRAEARAKSLGIPAATIRSHVKRGIEMLRERLDARSNGDREAWMSSLLALARAKPEALTAVGAAWLSSGGWFVAKWLVLLVFASGVFAFLGRAVCVAPQQSTPAIAKSNQAAPPNASATTTAALTEPAAQIESARTSVASTTTGTKRAAIPESFGRVIDAVTRAPIAGARVEVFFDDTPFAPSELGASPSHPIVAESDAEGRFRAAVPPVGEIEFRISSDGYAHAFVTGERNQTTAETAGEFRLYASPRIRIAVHHDATQAPPFRASLALRRNNLVFASNDAVVEPPNLIENWRVGQLDSNGRFVFGDLPIGDTFGFWCVAGSGKSLLKAEFVTLQAGETKDFEADTTEKHFVTIDGKLVDTTDSPIADHEVWLVADAADGVHGIAWDDKKDARIARTNSDGTFVFDKVLAGARVLVGPAASNWGTGLVERSGAEGLVFEFGRTVIVQSPNDRSVAPVAELVDVAPTAEGRIDVIVRAPRGVCIRGRALDPDGNPAAQVGVTLCWDALHVQYQQVETGTDGRFLFGPCGPGKYTLSANDRELARFADSDEVSASAGDLDAVVRLKRGGRIEGRVVDSKSGELVSGANVHINTRDEGGARSGWQILSAEEGTFDVGGLTFGSFDIVARANDGRIGVRRVTLDSAHDSASIDIPVSPAARLHAQCAPDNFYSVVQGEALVFTSLNAPTNPLELTVPSGELRVDFIDENSNAIESLSITLAPGELRMVSQTKR